MDMDFTAFNLKRTHFSGDAWIVHESHWTERTGDKDLLKAEL